MSIAITSQESLFNEVQFPDGQPVEVCYVVKRTPFEVFVEVEDVPFDFKTGKIECELFYAKPKDEKSLTPVSAIGTLCSQGSRSFEFVAHPVPNDSRKCKIEFRINVLSTQHNNLNFLFRIRLSHDGECLETFTRAIHSCSKLAQIRRKVEETRLDHGGDETAQVKAKKKRARCDDLIDKLQRIEDVQNRQTRMLQSISRREQPTSDSFDDDEAFPWRQDQQRGGVVKGDPLSLETSLTNFLDAYGSLSNQERPAKIRRILTSLPLPLQSLANNVGFFLSLDSIAPHQTSSFSAQPFEERPQAVTALPPPQPQQPSSLGLSLPYYPADLYDQGESGTALVTSSFMSDGDGDLEGDELSVSSASSYDPAL